MAGNKKRIAIEFSTSFNPQELAKLSSDLNKALGSSNISKQMKDNATKYVASITQASAGIERLKKKGSLDSQDFKELDSFTKDMQKGLLALQEMLTQVGAKPTEAMRNLSEELKRIDKQAKASAARIKSEFAGAVKGSVGEGVSFDNALNKIVQLRAEVEAITAKATADLEAAFNSDDEGARESAQKKYDKEIAKVAELKKEIDIISAAHKKYASNLTRSQNALKRSEEAAIDAAKASQELADSQLDQIKSGFAEKVKEQAENLENFANESKGAKDTISEMSAANEVFGNAFSEVGSKIKQVTSVIFIMRQAIQTLKKSFSVVSELDKQMTEIGIVSKQTNSELWDTFGTFNKLAKDLSSTTLQYLEGAKIFYQQGYQMAEVIDLVNATTKAATLSSVSFREASETLTAAIRAFNMEASQAASITDKFAAVGAFSAADFHELSVAMEKVASSAYSAGMSFDYTLGMLAKGVETTKEAPEAIGTALKTIIARFQEMKENPLAMLEDGVDANRVEKALKSVNVSLRDSSGEFRNLDDVFSDLGSVWGDLSRNQKAYIATMAAGMRQQSRFMAIMNDYDRTLELVRMSTNSAGEANRQYAIYVDSIEAAQNRLKNSQEAFYTSITSSDAIKNLYDGLSALLDVMTALNPSVLATVAGIGLLTSAILKFIVVKQTMTGAIVAGSLADKLANSAILKQIAATLNIAKAQGLQAGTATAATTATAALTAATLTFIAVALVLVVAIIAIVKAVEKKNNAVFKAAALAREEAEAAKELVQNLQNQIDRYDELNKVVNKSNEEKNELTEITDSIISQFPELLGGIDAEGKAYLKAGEALDEFLKKKELAAQEAERTAFQSEVAAMQAAKWDADLEKGAPGQGTVDASRSLETSLDSYRDNVVRKINSPAAMQRGASWGDTTDFIVQEQIASIEDYLNGTLEGGLDELESRLKDVTFTQYANESNEDFKARKEEVQSEIDAILKQIENYTNARVADTRIAIARGLFSIGSLELNSLEVAGEEVSNEYKDLYALLATSATEVAGNLTADDVGMSEEEFSKLSQSDLISTYSQHIHEEMRKAAEGFRKDDSFQKAMEDMYKLEESGASLQELDEASKNFFEPFLEGASQAEREVIESLQKRFFNQEDFSKMMTSVYNHATKNASINTEDLTDAFKNMNMQLSTAIGESLESLEDGDLKDKFLELIPSLFNNGEFQKRFEDQLANLDLNNPTAVKALTNELSEAIMALGDPEVTQEMAAQMAENMIEQQSQSVESFLKVAQETYATMSEITSLQEKALKDGLDLADALKAAEKFGSESLSFIGEGTYTLNYGELETKRRNEELKLTMDLQNAIESLNKDKIETSELTGQAATDAKRHNDLIDVQIDQYKKLTDTILEVTRAEQARIENQNVLTGISSINAQISSLKEFGDIYDRLNEGSLDFLDTLEAIGNNPDLIMALELTSNGLELQKDKLLEVAEAKKEETITFLASEKTKIDAAIAVVEANGKASESDIESAKQLISSTAEVSAAQKQATDAFLANKQLEIDAEYQLYLQTLDRINLENEALDIDKKAANRKRQVANLKTTSYAGSGEDIIEQLKAQYGTDSKDELLDILKGQSSKYEALIDGLNKITPEQMLMKATKKGTSDKSNQEKEFEKFFGEFDKYFNYLEKIERFSSEVAKIDLELGLEENGVKSIDLIKKKSRALANQTQVLESLVNVRKRDLELSKEEGQAKYSGFINFIGDEIEVRWDLINALEISSEAEKEWYDNLLEFINGYSESTSAIKENTQALLENQQAIKDMSQALIDEAIGTRQQLYDALVEIDQREIDRTKDKYQQMKEVQDNYLQAVKKAIDKERQLRNESEKQEDLAAKRRRLSVLERDTSGLYAQEAATLRTEISKDEQSIRDQQIDRQYEALQKQYELQQEQRDLEVAALEEQMTFRQETSWYWEQVDSVVREGAAAMQNLLTNTDAFIAADPLEQEKTRAEIAMSTQKLDELYKAGALVSVSDTGVVNAIINGVQNIVNQIADSNAKMAEFNAQQLTTQSVSRTSTSPSAQGGNSSTNATSSQVGGSSKGSKELSLQHFLNAHSQLWGGARLDPDGRIGPKTKAEIDKMFGYLRSKVFSEMSGASLSQYLNPLNQAQSSREINSLVNSLLKRFTGNGLPFDLPLKYKEGGIVDYTGPAWVDGSTNKPEAFLNADQTKVIAGLRDVLQDGFGNASINNTSQKSSSINMGNVNVYLANSVGASANDVGKAVREEIMKSFENRTSLGIRKAR